MESAHSRKEDGQERGRIGKSSAALAQNPAMADFWANLEWKEMQEKKNIE